MDVMVLAASYRAIGELLMHPDERDQTRVAALVSTLRTAAAEIAGRITAFMYDERAWNADEYVQTLELSPPCPLYIGSYLFDEPTNCRGAGTSGRNAYMVELKGIYRHFGFELAARELPDFLPVVLEFAALGLELGERDRIGLRRHFLEHHVQPGIAPLREALCRYESPYALLVEALGATIDLDLAAQGDVRPWKAPDQHRTVHGHRALPMAGSPWTHEKENRP